MVKDVEGEKIATEWISEALGGDAIQSREREEFILERRGMLSESPSLSSMVL